MNDASHLSRTSTITRKPSSAPTSTTTSKMASVSIQIPLPTPSFYPPSPTAEDGQLSCTPLGPSYLPTPPLSLSPPAPDAFRVAPVPRPIQLQTLALPGFEAGAAEQVMHSKIAEMARLGEDEAAFFVGDLGEVWKAWKSWVTELSRVELFYAVKCNPDPLVLQLLANLGTGFDCASQAEFTTVLSLPSPPPASKIIFANPCKPASFIRAARTLSVDLTTFDNMDELLKIARLHPGARLVLRLLTDDSKSLCRLGLKFGAPLETCRGLLQLAKDLGLDVVGVSFHVGSGCKDPSMFDDAVGRARAIFDLAAGMGFALTLLDIGGGFEKENFIETAKVLSTSLDRHFPREMNVRIIGEPGRFLVSSAFTLATSIIARRAAAAAVIGGAPVGGAGSGARTGALTPVSDEDDDMSAMSSSMVSLASLDGSLEGSKHPAESGVGENEGPKVMYYINDGVYGSFNCIMFDHQIVHPFPLTLSSSPAPFPPAFPPNVQLEEDLTLSMGYRAGAVPASVWGPTCDSIDCVRNVVMLPETLQVGDWLGWGEMGAYTICAASTFNGFNKSTVHYTSGGDSDAALAVERALARLSL